MSNQDDRSELNHALAAMHYNMNYADAPCVHCGQPMPRYGESNAQNEAIRSNTDTSRVVAVHASCFYKHEADEQWKADNPDAKPIQVIDEGDSRP